MWICWGQERSGCVGELVCNRLETTCLKHFLMFEVNATWQWFGHVNIDFRVMGMMVAGRFYLLAPAVVNQLLLSENTTWGLFVLGGGDL